MILFHSYKNQKSQKPVPIPDQQTQTPQKHSLTLTKQHKMK